jgi:flagellar hook assembly protein FlgD
MAQVDVGVYDSSGRLVRRLASSNYPAGVQALVWNGEDEGGRPVASGVYYIRARSYAHDERLKVVVLR